MGIDHFQGRKLAFNDTLTYRTGWPAVQNPQAPAQPPGPEPYIGKVVDFTESTIGVRADGWWGAAPLYYVAPEDILSVEPYVAPRSAVEERERARLARRERGGPAPDPDTPEALVATLADWGAEHRPHEPCPACGCTLWWTAAGADMCAQCLPMPRLSEQSWERIARLFPRQSVERDRLNASAVDAWSKPPQPDSRLRKGPRRGRSL